LTINYAEETEPLGIYSRLDYCNGVSYGSALHNFDRFHPSNNNVQIYNAHKADHA